MSAWILPTSLTIGGVGYDIRTDFRDILHILRYFSDPDYEDDEKWMICMQVLFLHPESIPPEHYEEAAQQAVAFIDMGIGNDGHKRPTCMDWEYDAPILIPAINRVLGREVRAIEYLHWWTFLGAYMEIGESLFSSVLNIRQKKAKGKKLEQHEREFMRENRDLITIPKKYSEAEKAKRDKLNKLLD